MIHADLGDPGPVASKDPVSAVSAALAQAAPVTVGDVRIKACLVA
jgi:hypothetical protein